MLRSRQNTGYFDKPKHDYRQKNVQEEGVYIQGSWYAKILLNFE
jgi:hypothetical protein